MILKRRFEYVRRKRLRPTTIAAALAASLMVEISSVTLGLSLGNLNTARDRPGPTRRAAALNPLAGSSESLRVPRPGWQWGSSHLRVGLGGGRGSKPRTRLGAPG